jgi:hypothetical protein
MKMQTDDSTSPKYYTDTCDAFNVGYTIDNPSLFATSIPYLNNVVSPLKSHLATTYTVF